MCFVRTLQTQTSRPLTENGQRQAQENGGGKERTLQQNKANNAVFCRAGLVKTFCLFVLVCIGWGRPGRKTGANEVCQFSMGVTNSFHVRMSIFALFHRMCVHHCLELLGAEKS